MVSILFEKKRFFFVFLFDCRKEEIESWKGASTFFSMRIRSSPASEALAVGITASTWVPASLYGAPALVAGAFSSLETARAAATRRATSCSIHSRCSWHTHGGGPCVPTGIVDTCGRALGSDRARGFVKATPRMLWRTVLSFVGGKGSIAACIVMGGFIIGSGTASLPFGSLGLCLVLDSLGLSPLSVKPSCRGHPLIHTSCHRVLYLLERSCWPLGQC